MVLLLVSIDIILWFAYISLNLVTYVSILESTYIFEHVFPAYSPAFNIVIYIYFLMLVLFHVFSNILANLKELSFTFITTNVVIFQLFWLTIDSLILCLIKILSIFRITEYIEIRFYEKNIINKIILYSLNIIYSVNSWGTPSRRCSALWCTVYKSQHTVH